MAAVHLSDDESGEWNRVQLAAGRFETRLFRVVPELQFSPWLSLVNNIQYDSVSAEVGWQSRSIDGLHRRFSTPSGSERDAKHNRPTRRIPVRAVFPEVYA